MKSISITPSTLTHYVLNSVLNFMPINLTSSEAFAYLQDSGASALIDVRDQGEWQAWGVPQINSLILLSWRFKPAMILNSNFITDLMQKVPDRNQKLFFICAGGARSFEAALAATESGYQNCYNISDGFSGSGFGLGWKQNNLPWQIL